MQHLIISCNKIRWYYKTNIYIMWGRRGRYRIVYRFTTTYAISVYNHYRFELKSAHGQVYSMQHYVIKLSVTCSRSMVYSGFIHWLNWQPWYNWSIVESGVKHHNHNPSTSCVTPVSVWQWIQHYFLLFRWTRNIGVTTFRR